jgi:hypothetical protein
MKIIGITGLARSGKDSFYDLSKPIIESFNQKHTRYAFADALKEESNELLSKYAGISAFTEKNSEKKIIRPFLVTYGTHVRRKLDPNCWINKVQRKIEQDTNKDSWVFVTDVRYENEIEWIKKLNGKTIHVTREGNIAPNQEEIDNNPILREKSDWQISWKDFELEDMKLIKQTISQILKHI